jgi:AcrR family transcriptional regulator
MAESLLIAARRFVWLPIDDCRYLLEAASVGASQAAVYRCFRREGLTPLPARDDDSLAAGWFDLHRVSLAGKNGGSVLFVAVERPSRYVITGVYPERQGNITQFLHLLQKTSPLTLTGIVIEQSSWTPHLERELLRFCTAFALQRRLSRTSWKKSDRALYLPTRRHIGGPWAELGRGVVRDELASLVEMFNHRCRFKCLGGLTPAAAVSSDNNAMTTASTATHRARRQVRIAREGETKREVLLHFARSLLASGGPESISLAKLSRTAGVNRGTVYRYFRSRAALLEAIDDWSSEQLATAVFEKPLPRRADPEQRVLQVQQRIANFAIRNPVVCQAWLLRIITMPDPSKDHFWREYYGRSKRFHETPLAAEGIDGEVMSVIMLAGAFLWPVWARSKSRGETNVQGHADRFVREFSRLSMHGAIRLESAKTVDRAAAPSV